MAVEADWPDAYRVNRYVRRVSDDTDANAALSGFKRLERFLLLLRDNDQLAGPLKRPRLQRAIGVIYLPETERMSRCNPRSTKRSRSVERSLGRQRRID